MCFCKKYRANKSVSQPYSITNFINILVISGLLCIYNKCKFKCNHCTCIKMGFSDRNVRDGWISDDKLKLCNVASSSNNTTKLYKNNAWAAAHLLRSWVRIPLGAWIFVCCECRVLSGRGLCDELITRPEESYRLWCVVVCDLETSRIGAPYIYIYIWH